MLRLIGGGVFGDSLALIWESTNWALAEVEPVLSCNLDMVLNGRNLGHSSTRGSSFAPHGSGEECYWPGRERGRSGSIVSEMIVWAHLARSSP